MHTVDGKTIASSAHTQSWYVPEINIFLLAASCRTDPDDDVVVVVVVATRRSGSKEIDGAEVSSGVVVVVGMVLWCSSEEGVIS